jgi:protein-tyrosine phosphatase
MAEALLASRLSAKGVAVSSAGLAALVGRPAEPDACALLAERGLDLSGHRARQLTPALLREADLVLVMSQEQQRAVAAVDASARGRVYRIGHFGGFDVPDPYGQNRAAFERALDLIERGVEDFVQTFWGRNP